MGKRKNSTTTRMVMLFLLVFSLPALAVQALTTTQMRENSIRINALELNNLRLNYPFDNYSMFSHSLVITIPLHVDVLSLHLPYKVKMYLHDDL